MLEFSPIIRALTLLLGSLKSVCEAGPTGHPDDHPPHCLMSTASSQLGHWRSETACCPLIALRYHVIAQASSGYDMPDGHTPEPVFV